jgi:hypothetical protein
MRYHLSELTRMNVLALPFSQPIKNKDLQHHMAQHQINLLTNRVSDLEMELVTLARKLEGNNK